MLLLTKANTFRLREKQEERDRLQTLVAIKIVKSKISGRGVGLDAVKSKIEKRGE